VDCAEIVGVSLTNLLLSMGRDMYLQYWSWYAWMELVCINH